ncbi:MAG: DUF692 domain-containing protein [Planctomycetota bacterium]
MDSPSTPRFDNLGFGLGLRTVHYGKILNTWPKVDFFEVVTENFLDTEGRPIDVLLQVAGRYPVILHGVSMSAGSTDPIDKIFLRKIKSLANRINARWISDHVCWSSIDGQHLHDLLPLPYDAPTLRHLIKRVKQIQQFLGAPLVLENPSSYLAFQQSTMTEWEFIAKLAEESNCGLLLDINNVYVSSVNHGFDPNEYIDHIPKGRVAYFHLAGHTRYETHILDTHSASVIDPVWNLYVRAQKRFGGRATIVEWDEDIPEFDIVNAELERAKLELTKAGQQRLVRAAAHSRKL